jgi:pimeloyl-ACP methyl ester carboxylesterase
LEKLITNMMRWANVTEEEPEARGTIHSSFGEDLSWNYLCYVRSHPIRWTVPTKIFYGSRDNLRSLETIHDSAKKHKADLTIINDGEHWFHTEEQMRFLDNWILGKRRQQGNESDEEKWQEVHLTRRFLQVTA